MNNAPDNKVSSEDKTTVIEAKIPLWWIIGSAVAIVFSMGGVIVKLDQLGMVVQKIEAKLDTQESRITTVYQSVYESKSDNRIQQMQIDKIEATLNSYMQRQQQR